MAKKTPPMTGKTGRKTTGKMRAAPTPSGRTPRKKDDRPPLLVLENVESQLGKVRQLLGNLQKPQLDLKTASSLAAESAKLEQEFRRVRQSAETFQASSLQRADALLDLRQQAPPKPSKRKKASDLDVEPEASFTFQRPAQFGGPGAAADTSVTQPGETDLTSIFKLVTEGFINAQKQLDDQSIAYVAQIKDPRIPPALFSIPSVKAETKIALTVENQSNIVVKLFGSPTDRKNYAESSLSFDIVAAPPPPDGLSPLPSFLLTGATRDQVIQKAMTSAVTDAVRSRATVFRIQNDTTPYLLILAGATPTDPVTIFRVSLDPQSPPATQVPFSGDASALAVLADIAAAIKQWEAVARPSK